MRNVPTRQVLEEELWDYIQTLFEGREILSTYITEGSKKQSPSAYVCCWDDKMEFVRNIRISFHKAGRNTKNVDLSLLMDNSLRSNKKELNRYLSSLEPPKLLRAELYGYFVLFYHTRVVRVKAHQTETKAIVQIQEPGTVEWKTCAHFNGYEYRKLSHVLYPIPAK